MTANSSSTTTDAAAASETMQDQLPSDGPVMPASADSQPASPATGSRIRRLLLVLLINGPSVMTGVEASIFEPFFPLEATAKAQTPAHIGVVFASFAVAHFVTSIAAGALVPLLGLRFALVSSCLGMTAATLLIAFVTRVPGGSTFLAACLVLRIVGGICAAIADVSTITCAMERFPDQLPLVMVSRSL